MFFVVIIESCLSAVVLTMMHSSLRARSAYIRRVSALINFLQNLLFSGRLVLPVDFCTAGSEPRLHGCTRALVARGSQR